MKKIELNKEVQYLQNKYGSNTDVKLLNNRHVELLTDSLQVNSLNEVEYDLTELIKLATNLECSKDSYILEYVTELWDLLALNKTLPSLKITIDFTPKKTILFTRGESVEYDFKSALNKIYYNQTTEVFTINITQG
jgi:hypothetical protein